MIIINICCLLASDITVTLVDWVQDNVLSHWHKKSVNLYSLSVYGLLIHILSEQCCAIPSSTSPWRGSSYTTGALKSPTQTRTVTIKTAIQILPTQFLQHCREYPWIQTGKKMDFHFIYICLIIKFFLQMQSINDVNSSALFF
jgi:hypothetical protein